VLACREFAGALNSASFKVFIDKFNTACFELPIWLFTKQATQTSCQAKEILAGKHSICSSKQDSHNVNTPCGCY